ncbi:DUF2268 domain-containing protein [Pseudogracilibacillus sp. SO30301A]|uniref:DUF2268 domain-containing protein n=1 Tax=Pseudogracilibacillus sp. SO30301A TaxID=3098291 RepID=UPI00300DD84B
MSVIRTDLWLLDLYDNPIKICAMLTEYFKEVSAAELYNYLTLHGMYRQPSKNGITLVKRLQNKNIWKFIQYEEQVLQKIWKGLNVPIFIMPSESNDQNLKQNFNGKSGISFRDKIFLFISEHNEENELKALLTHEYNHVCRLSKYEKDVKDYVLLDSIILEGLAENAVRERSGGKFVSKWVSYYSKERLEGMWKNIVQPNKNIPINNRKHHQILYGVEPYPNMAGYCVGYYLVKKFIEKHGSTCIDLIDQPSKKIVESIF